MLRYECHKLMSGRQYLIQMSFKLYRKSLSQKPTHRILNIQYSY